MKPLSWDLTVTQALSNKYNIMVRRESRPEFLWTQMSSKKAWKFCKTCNTQQT